MKVTVWAYAGKWEKSERMTADLGDLKYVKSELFRLFPTFRSQVPQVWHDEVLRHLRNAIIKGSVEFERFEGHTCSIHAKLHWLCEWCDQAAERVDEGDVGLCRDHARNEYGSEWRAMTRKCGEMARRRILDHEDDVAALRGTITRLRNLANREA